MGDWSDADARRAAKTLLASPTFARSKRGRELLAYLIERTLDGRQDEIKAFSIACDVFGRDEKFDADNDALVRVQAARVRTLLEEYYAGEGKDERLRISLPKGAYIPVFEIAEASARARAETPVAPGNAARTEPQAENEAEPQSKIEAELLAELKAAAPAKPKGAARLSWFAAALAVVALAAFLGLGWLRPETRKPARADLSPGDGSLSVLVAAFTKYSPEVPDKSVEFIRSQLLQLTQLSFVTVYSDKAPRPEGAEASEADPMEVARQRGVRYLLEGRVLGADDALRVSIDLVDVKSGKYVWTQTYDQNTPAGPRSLDNFALALMSSLHVVLLRAASSDARTVNLDSATPWDLYFLATWIPGFTRNSLVWEKERVAMARRAIAIDPNFGPALSLLAGKIAYLANVDPQSDQAEALIEAKRFGQKALEVSPGDADVIFNVAIYYWQVGRVEDALALIRRTLEIAPHYPVAPFLVNALAYTCALAPQNVIDQLIAYDAQLPPQSAQRWFTLSWIAMLYLDNGDFPRAVDFGRRSFTIFHAPDNVFRLAAALAQTGDTQGAREIVQSQREYWPSLNPEYYADVTIPRRCGQAPRADYVRGLYRQLALAVEAGKGR